MLLNTATHAGDLHAHHFTRAHTTQPNANICTKVRARAHVVQRTSQSVSATATQPGSIWPVAYTALEFSTFESLWIAKFLIRFFKLIFIFILFDTAPDTQPVKHTNRASCRAVASVLSLSSSKVP
jgi:hypothetical protein